MYTIWDLKSLWIVQFFSGFDIFGAKYILENIKNNMF